MTLDTRITLDGPITGPEAFDLALGALLDAANRGAERTTAQIERNSRGSVATWLKPDATEEQVERWRRTTDQITTVIGQGLPGIVEAEYIEGGRLPEWRDEDEPERVLRTECSVALSWDTAYSYSEGGLDCTSLHASALLHLKESLPEGVTMRWQNEYTGRWHGGVEPEDLRDFLGGGDSAQAWFLNVVVPFIVERGGSL